MQIIIPIQNFQIDFACKVDDVIFLPNFFSERMEEVLEDAMLIEVDKKKLIDIFTICSNDYDKEFLNYTVAVFERNMTPEQYQCSNIVNEFLMLERFCNEIDRNLDYIRLSYCDFTRPETYPGIPGIVGNYRKGIAVDLEYKTCRGLLGDVYNVYNNPGIGLYIEGVYFNEHESEFYSYFYSSRSDEIYFTCRNALGRVNEAMYMNNPNTQFVYIMSTLEMLTSRQYVGFQQVKTSIASFLAKDRKDYHRIADKLKILSQNFRTEIVHNGKNIMELCGSKEEINKLLIYLVRTVILYTQEILKSGVTDFERLTKLRTEKTKTYTM